MLKCKLKIEISLLNTRKPMSFRPHKSRDHIIHFSRSYKELKSWKSRWIFFKIDLYYKLCFVKVVEVESYTGDPSFMAQLTVNPKTFSLHW